MHILVQHIKAKGIQCPPQRHLAQLEKLVEDVQGFSPFDFNRPNQSNFEDLLPIYEADQSKDTIVISVIDNGCGIDAEDQKNLFQMFGRLKKTKGLNANGVGLGLVICKMMSREFGGEV